MLFLKFRYYRTAQWLNILTLIVVAFTASSSSCFAYGKGSNYKGSQSRSVLSVDPLDLQEEIGLSGGGSFITPNEGGTYLYKSELDEMVPGGALISVGTMRGMVLAGLGNFSHVLLMDFSEDETTFNRLHIQLIQAIGQLPLSPKLQRYIYFSVLHGNNPSLKQLKKIKDKEQYQSWHPGYFPTLFTSIFDPEVNAIYKTLEPASDIHQFLIRHGGFYSESFPDQLRPLMRSIIALNQQMISNRIHRQPFLSNLFFRYHRELSRLSKYYWENDSDWNKIIELALMGRIQAISGSVFGSETLKSIGIELQKRGERVSVVDISNILHFRKPCAEDLAVGSEYGSTFFQTQEMSLWKDCRSKLARNLSKLPRASDSKLFRTIPRGRPFFGGRILGSPPTDIWSYSSITISDYFYLTLRKAPSPTAR